MLHHLPKLFRHPEILHDLVAYRFPSVPKVKFDNWVAMNRMLLDTRSFSVPAYPYLLQVEPTNRCNLACPLCPCGRGELERPPRDMKLSEFQGLIDDMEPYLLFLILWDWGEPFMNRELPAMIRYAADRGIQTVTSTNCHFLQDEEYVTAILRSGLTNLIVAVDSVSVSNYATYRQQGNVATVVSGVEQLVALKRRLGSKTRINLRMVVMRQNEHEVAATRDFARAIGVDLFTVKTANPSCGETYLDSEILPDNPHWRRYVYAPGSYQRLRARRSCRRVWTMSNVFADGEVVPCCRDYTAGMILGNLREQPFTSIWRSPAYQRLRETVFRRKDEIGICHHCDDSFRFSPGGMIPEVTEFDRGEPSRLRRTLDQPRLKSFCHQLRKRL